jgi:transposase, IS30 family
MTSGYHHLTYEQRCQIYALKKSGQCNALIARQLGVHRATIGRELARNTGERGYRYGQAHARCMVRRRRNQGIARKMTPHIIAKVDEKLVSAQWSPEQISGWLKESEQVEISHERIYQHVIADKKAGGTLHVHLRRKQRKYQKRFQGKTLRGRIKGRVDISERPKVVEERSRIGDWEADTVVSSDHKSAIVTLVERVTRICRIVKVDRNGAAEVRDAIIAALSSCAALVLTVTFDNGKEFAYHEEVAKALACKTYFAKPYHSWERGLNENTNGLIRQYFPKGTNFATVTHEQVETVQHLLNNRPRKCLNYQSPNQRFQPIPPTPPPVALQT